MGNSKFGRFILVGAVLGGIISLCDRSTRRHVKGKTGNMVYQAKYYSKNPDVLKEKLQQQKDKYMSIYEQLSGDAAYIKTQVQELKALTPQVKELVVDTKEAFVESKEEYKEIVNEQKVGAEAKKI
ncbi:YtxH domain-containing protein [Sporosarcina highlanderae]|uniref:YtxH domain-containing protein n=1 Tax=Sporosarcina highlanderae TaxID=3035916 RepID=A0ABT8JT86_9BACL|nr:YtxH domain-containing protein [Sporosarcina highlanderae]MDN4608376.1 YtxH domain-containing protein [Sporosarcina highlanderae]